MQDEQFMRSWNADHSRFSADLDRGLGHLVGWLSAKRKGAKNIGDPYGIPTEVKHRQALSPAAQASLRGLAASVITAALWVVVMALATPAPGLAASQLANAACLAHPVLA